MTKKIALEIDVDEGVAEKYPNYKKNFKNIEEFIVFLLEDIVVDNSLFGYTIKLAKNGNRVAEIKE